MLLFVPGLGVGGMIVEGWSNPGSGQISAWTIAMLALSGLSIMLYLALQGWRAQKESKGRGRS